MASLLVAACGGEGTVFTVPAGAGSTTTAPEVTTTSGAGTTTSSTAEAAAGEPVVWQVLQRCRAGGGGAAATREGPGDPFQGCPRSLDLVAPIVGEDTSALTEERFGFGPVYAHGTLG